VEAKCKENEEETESWTRDEKKDEDEEEEGDDGCDSTTNLLLQIAGGDLYVVTCIPLQSQ
jgi:tetrahydromethanopterin S-methyltransferase subunit H